MNTLKQHDLEPSSIFLGTSVFYDRKRYCQSSENRDIVVWPH